MWRSLQVLRITEWQIHVTTQLLSRAKTEEINGPTHPKTMPKKTQAGGEVRETSQALASLNILLMQTFTIE
jgi:hypothetical protein